jgi:hypothetical protein
MPSLKPTTRRLLEIPILVECLAPPIIDLVAEYAADDHDLVHIIAMLARDIRGSYCGKYDDRVFAIKKLCSEAGQGKWTAHIEHWQKDGLDDGRWFRDLWSGPYDIPMDPRFPYPFLEIRNLEWLQRNALWTLFHDHEEIFGKSYGSVETWHELKMEWNRYHNPEFQHCKTCELEVPHISSRTRILGKGYGSSHRWSKGSTLWSSTTQPLMPHQKHTHYQCVECDAHFLHFYDITPDIFDAIEQAGISDQCIP